MKKEKLLLILVISLVLINLLTLGFFMLKGKGHHSPPHMPKGKGIAFLQKEFDFTDEQMVKVELSVNKNKNQIEEEQEKLAGYSRQYYLLNGNPVKKDSILLLILNTTSSIYKINDSHINDIKSLAGASKNKELEGFIHAATHYNNRKPMPK